MTEIDVILELKLMNLSSEEKGKRKGGKNE